MAVKALIQTVTVGAGGAASVEFAAIAADYTDLCLVANIRNTSGNDAFLKINGTTINFTSKHLNGTGSAASSFGRTDGFIGHFNPSGSTGSTFGSMEIYFPNYASATNKSFSIDSVTENNATLANQFLTAGLWSNTAAITSITLLAASGNLAYYSTASLYGIKYD
jgi:hypothetical protein